MRAEGPLGPSASSSGIRTAPAREVLRSVAYRAETAKERAWGPARLSGRIESTRTSPSPSRRPPTRSPTACAVRPPAVTRLAARFELLDDALSQIQRLIRGNDPVVGRAHIEDHGVVAGGPHAFDDAVDLALNGIEEFALPGGSALLQLLSPLLQLLLLGLEVLPLGGALGRAQHDRLLIEIRRRGIEAGLKLLHFDPVGGELFGEGRLGFDVSGRLLEDRLSVDKGNLGACLLSRERPGPQHRQSSQAHPDAYDDTLHASLPMKGAYFLEEIPQLEMELPARVGLPVGIHPIEAVAEIHADRPQRRDDRGAETGAPEQPGRIPLAGRSVDVSGVEKRTHVQRLTDAGAGFDRECRV